MLGTMLGTASGIVVRPPRSLRNGRQELAEVKLNAAEREIQKLAAHGVTQALVKIPRLKVEGIEPGMGAPAPPRLRFRLVPGGRRPLDLCESVGFALRERTLMRDVNHVSNR
jgi:hypothetical protein